MEQSVLEEILDTAVPGEGFARAGQPQLKGDVWTIPFRHHQFGLGQIFLPDREVVNASARRALAKEIGEQLGHAVVSSQ
jgi:hypothetical protein